jgi:hypothetical protein
MSEADLPLRHCDEERAVRAIDGLRAAHPAAAAIADRLEEAARTRRISTDVLTQHSRWCNTGGSWIAGVEPARDAALAMYGFVPGRLIAGDGRSDPSMLQLLAEYRRRLNE